MAIVKLELESNAEQGLSVVNQLGDSVSTLTAETKDFNKESSKSFTAATKNLDEFNKEVKEGGKQIKGLAEGAKNIGGASGRIKELKKEIKDLTSQAFAAGEGTKAFTENLKKAGALKDEINDINAALQAVSQNAGGNLAKALGTSTSIGIQGFEGLVAAQSLFGTKSEDVERQLLKLNAVKSLAGLAGEFADIGDKITEIKLGLTPLTSAFTDNISNIKQGYSSANTTLKGFFSNFGPNIKDSLKSIGSGISGFFKNFGSNAAGLFTSLGTGIKDFAKSGVAGIKALGTALAANPLGIILVVIGAVIAVFVALRDKIKPVAAVFEFLSEVIDKAGEALTSLGEALGIVASQAEKNAEATIKNTDKEVEAISKRYEREIKLAQAAGKDTAEIEKEKLKAEAIRIGKSIAQLQYLNAINKGLNDEQLKEEQKLNEKLLDTKNELAVVTITQQTELAKKEAELRKKTEEDNKKAAEERKKRQSDLNAALIDLQKKSDQAQISSLSGEEKLNKQREVSKKEIEDLEKALIEKGKLVNKDFKLNAEQEQELANLKLLVNKEFNDGILKLRVEQANAIASERQKEITSELEFIQLKADLAEKQVKATTAPKGATKDEVVLFEAQKQIKILEIRKQAANDSLLLEQRAIDAAANIKIVALNNELTSLKDKDDAISNARKQAIAKEQGDILANAELSKDIIVAETAETVNGINKELENIGKDIKPKKVDFGKLLGGDTGEIVQFIKLKANVEVSAEDVESAKQAIQQMFTAIKQIVQDSFDAANKELDNQIKISDQIIEKRDENISELEDQLSTEEDLRAKGLANNTSRIQEAIEREKELRAGELEQQKKIQEEKKKLAIQQLKIDTALGASQLVVAIAQLFSALSSFTIGPVPVGLIIAIASSAAMIAAFASGKKKAFDAINSQSAATFEKGGYTGDMGTKQEAGIVHGREFVMTADKTNKYYDLFQGIHTDDKDLIKRGLFDLLQGTGVTMPQNLSKEIRSNRETIKSSEITLLGQNNNKGVEVRLDKLQEQVAELIKNGKNETTAMPNGSIINKKGNITTIIRGK